MKREIIEDQEYIINSLISVFENAGLDKYSQIFYVIFPKIYNEHGEYKSYGKYPIEPIFKHYFKFYSYEICWFFSKMNEIELYEDYEYKDIIDYETRYLSNKLSKDVAVCYEKLKLETYTGDNLKDIIKEEYENYKKAIKTKKKIDINDEVLKDYIKQEIDKAILNYSKYGISKIDIENKPKNYEYTEGETFRIKNIFKQKTRLEVETEPEDKEPETKETTESNCDIL